MRFVTVVPAVGTVLVLAWGTATAQQSIRTAVDVQTQSQNDSAAVQARINELDDSAREMLNEYRQALSQVSDLDAYNEQLEGLAA